MNKDVILNFRKTTDVNKIFVISDNMKLYDESAKYQFLIWDDEKEILSVIRLNDNNKDYDIFPFYIEELQYDNIQYIGCSANASKLNEFLTNMESDMLITEEKKKEIYKEMVEATTYSTEKYKR